MEAVSEAVVSVFSLASSVDGGAVLVVSVDCLGSEESEEPLSPGMELVREDVVSLAVLAAEEAPVDMVSEGLPALESASLAAPSACWRTC